MTSERPFRILGVQQIAIGAKDKSKLRHLWVDLLGLKVVGNYSSKEENVIEDICEIGTGPSAVELDLMENLNPNGKHNVSERALHHFGIWVDDLTAAYKWLSENGVRFGAGGIRKGASGHNVCFIHPKGNDIFPFSGEGVLIELVQAPTEMIISNRISA